MSLNRVQKLLFSEYCDFEDMVLIESPFAQTTQDGTGLRQVQLGLTPSKIILATDVLPPVDISKVAYCPGIDPDIETFELIAIYPVECVNLSVYRRRKRQALKARFCNNRVLYFELGGFEKRNMFWNLWCEKVRFLNPEDAISSNSETSVDTSTSSSTLYLVNKKIVVKNGLKQLWCRFGPNPSKEEVHTELTTSSLNGNKSLAHLIKRWSEKNLFLGELSESPLSYQPIMDKPVLSQFLAGHSTKQLLSANQLHGAGAQVNQVACKKCIKINRFGSGICEGCGTGLYLPVGHETPSRDGAFSLHFSYSEFEKLAEAAVQQWELFRGINNKECLKHRRRYGFVPQSHFLHGFGLMKINLGGQYSIQNKRAVSLIDLQSPFELDIPRNQLIASVSCENLGEHCKAKTNVMAVPKSPVINFWTPGYTYVPRTPKEIYQTLQNHLMELRNYLIITEQLKKNKTKRKKKKIKRSYLETDDEGFDLLETDKTKGYQKRKSIHWSIKRKLNRHNRLIKANCCWLSLKDYPGQPKDPTLNELKVKLFLELDLIIWNFDSATLAEQLTMIDKELFLKINSSELEILLFHQNSKHSANIATYIAFSNRISCLVGTEILKTSHEKVRARLVARFINIANKCHRISNFQSCKSILAGLQSPAIYRLKATWALVRKKHASKYHIFEILCRLHKDPRFPTYQRTFHIISQTPPFLPYIGDILAKLLDKIPHYTITSQRSQSFTRRMSCDESFKSISSIESTPEQLNLFEKLLKVFSSMEPGRRRKALHQAKRNRIPQENKSSKPVYNKLKSLSDYYDPLDRFEDNREDCLQRTKEFLEKCQVAAMGYCFDINEMARSYLLKARYEGELENFCVSLSLEEVVSSSVNKGV